MDITAKPIPATLAIKYDIMGNGFICVVNVQLASHQDTPEAEPAGATTLKYFLGRLSAAIETELALMQKQTNESVN